MCSLKWQCHEIEKNINGCKYHLSQRKGWRPWARILIRLKLLSLLINPGFSVKMQICSFFNHKAKASSTKLVYKLPVGKDSVFDETWVWERRATEPVSVLRPNMDRRPRKKVSNPYQGFQLKSLKMFENCFIISMLKLPSVPPRRGE